MRRIHIISSGREGSCFMQSLAEKAGDGLPAVFEPLGGVVEGSRIMSQSLDDKRSQISCLYSESASGCNDRIKPDSLNKLEETLASSDHPPIVLKTTRIANLTLMAETLSPEQQQSSKFLVLLRDPRAVWASFKPFVSWAVHSIPLVCQIIAETVLTAPALAEVVPDNLEFGIYERWSEDVVRWAKEFGEFIGQNSDEMVAYAQEKQQEVTTPDWITDLTDEEVSEIENDPNCAAYMERVGYKQGKSSGGDYSSLRSTEELRQELGQKETDALASLNAMSSQAIATFIAVPTDEPLFEFRYEH